MAKTVIMRILCAVPVDGVVYQPDQLVEFPADRAKSLEKSGQADAHADAVAYAKGLGSKVVKHEVPAASSADGEGDGAGGQGGGNGS